MLFETKARGYGGSGVARSKPVEWRFSSRHKTTETAEGSYRVKQFIATGENFVCVSLVASVPDNSIFPRVEDPVEARVNSIVPRFDARCPRSSRQLL